MRRFCASLPSRGDAVYALHRPDGAKPENLNGVDRCRRTSRRRFDTGLPGEIDAVVHLAQSRRYRDFPEGAADVFEVNANATVRLLDWAREAGARSFVYASSGAVYPPGPEPASEDQPVSPGNFYAASKRSGELACEQFRSELTAHVLRFFFIYGPGHEDMFLPGVLGRIRRDDEVALAGEDGIRLNPVYVDDAVRAIVELLARPESMTLNVAGPDVVSLRELSELAGQLLDRTPRYAMGDPHLTWWRRSRSQRGWARPARLLCGGPPAYGRRSVSVAAGPRILHAPTDIGGHARGLSLAEQELGLRSDVAVFSPQRWGYEADIDLHAGIDVPVPVRMARRAAFLREAIERYDVFHFNYGQTLMQVRQLGRVLDELPLLRRRGKKILVTFQGCDLRPFSECFCRRSGLRKNKPRIAGSPLNALWSTPIVCCTSIPISAAGSPAASSSPTRTSILARSSRHPVPIARR